MTVGNLIAELQRFDENTPVVLGMIQNYGSNFAMNIDENVEMHVINKFYGNDIKAVVITEGNQIGVVDYDDNDWYGDEEDNEC